MHGAISGSAEFVPHQRTAFTVALYADEQMLLIFAVHFNH